MAYPVTDPVVRADIDERTDTALKEGSDIILRGEYLVHVQQEGKADVVVAETEVASERRVDADCFSDILAVEEGTDVSL